jgi:hypothetical protein
MSASGLSKSCPSLESCSRKRGVRAARLKEEGNNRKEEFIERGKKRGRRKTGETIERREEMDGWMWRNGGMDG